MSGSSYVYIFGIHFDANGETWGMSIGEAFFDTRENPPVPDRIQTGTGTALYTANDHVVVEDCEIEGSKQGLVHISSGSSHVDIINNEIHGNSIGSDSRPNAEGIYIGTGTRGTDRSHDITIAGNHIYDIGKAGQGRGEAIDIKVQAYNVTVVDNLIENVTVASQGAITVLYDDTGFPSGETNPNIKISRNRIRGVTPDSSDGQGIWIGARGVEVSNNIIWDVHRAGIFVGKRAANTSGDVRVWNNTIGGILGGGTPVGIEEEPGTRIVPSYRNNVARAAGVGSTYVSSDGPSGTFVGPTTGTAAVTGGEIGSGFALKSSSSAVDSGTDVSGELAEDATGAPRRLGRGVDYGAIETADEDAPPTGTALVVRASGTTGTERVEVSADGQLLGSRMLSTSLTNYSFDAPTGATELRITFVNDGTSGGADRNVRIDRVTYLGTVYEAEAPDNENTGVYDPARARCGGIPSERLDCDGFIRIPVAASGGITVRARGTTGEEEIEVSVDGVVVGATQRLTTAFRDYTFPLATTDPGEVRVAFVNDARTSAGDRNVRVDYLEVAGERYEAESPANTNTGAWNAAASRCGGIASQQLDCGGHIDFPLASSVALAVRARGTTGEEEIQVFADGQPVGPAQRLTLDYADYELELDSRPEEVRVAFVNDARTAAGDRNVRIDYLVVGGTRYQAESPDNTNTGAWNPAAGGCGGIASEQLDCGGHIDFPVSAIGSFFEQRSARGTAGADVFPAHGLAVFPNPVARGGTLSLTGLPGPVMEHPVELVVTDVAGREVARVKTTSVGGRAQLETAGLPRGTYAVYVGGGETAAVSLFAVR